MKLKAFGWAGALLLCAARLASAELSSGIDRANFDTAVRPQDDLYVAVNGTWLRKTEIPADKSNYGAFIALEDLSRDRLQSLIQKIVKAPHPAGSEAQKIADMYRSYTDLERIEKLGLTPLEQDLKAIDALSSKTEVMRHFAAFSRIGVSVPIGFSVQIDAKNSGHYLVNLNQSGLGMPDRDYYLVDEGRFLEARKAYQSYVATLLTLSGLPEGEAKTAAIDILGLETDLARAQRSRVELRDPQKNYNKLTIAELKRDVPDFDWASYFDALRISPAEVNVNQPPFVKAVAELLSSKPLATWKSYLRLRLLNAYAPALPNAFDVAHFEFHGKVLGGVPMQKPREHRAIESIGGAHAQDFGVLGDALGKLYVDEYFPPESKARMDNLVRNLLAAYRSSINELTWMSPETKARAQDKLAKYAVKIGYTEAWRDYSGLTVTPDNLVENLKSSELVDFNRYVNRLGKPVDRREWGMTAFAINAYYSPVRNEIVFPAAILQPPFFNVEADDAVNYGSIGAVIGHEISHGFDDKGSQYDGDGNLKNWWTDADRDAFEKLTHKLVAQYAAYEPLPGKRLNGELTLGENIADLSGLSIAYKAYRLSLNGKEAPLIDGLSGDQRFFMGWAQCWARKYRDAEMAKRLLTDPHSPSHFRANGAPINMDAFHAAFGTKPGDQLYKAPEERLRIW
jgi:putative endopeptidase